MVKVKFTQNTGFYDGGKFIKARRGDTLEVSEETAKAQITCKHAVEVVAKVTKKAPKKVISKD